MASADNDVLDRVLPPGVALSTDDPDRRDGHEHWREVIGRGRTAEREQGPAKRDRERDAHGCDPGRDT